MTNDALAALFGAHMLDQGTPDGLYIVLAQEDVDYGAECASLYVNRDMAVKAERDHNAGVFYSPHQRHRKGEWRAYQLTPLSAEGQDWHIARCAECGLPPMPFADVNERDVWADAHTGGTGHTVTRYEEKR